MSTGGRGRYAESQRDEVEEAAPGAMLQGHLRVGTPRIGVSLEEQ